MPKFAYKIAQKSHKFTYKIKQNPDIQPVTKPN